MRKAYQYRWVKNNMAADADNIWPKEDEQHKEITPQGWIARSITGHLFADKTPIYQLGIQALPGTKFFLNGGIDPVIIGATGIYELDLQDKASISALRFDAESMKTIEKAGDAGNGFLIVDIVYEGEEE